MWKLFEIKKYKNKKNESVLLKANRSTFNVEIVIFFNPEPQL